MSGPGRHNFQQHRSEDDAGDPIGSGKVPTADGASGWTYETPATSSLTIKDEGTPLATAATSIDFVGAGVTASGTGAGKTVTIPGFGGALDDLSDVVITSAAAGDRLRYSGTAWVNSSLIWRPLMVLDPTSGNYLPVTTGAGDAVMTEA